MNRQARDMVNIAREFNTARDVPRNHGDLSGFEAALEK